MSAIGVEHWAINKSNSYLGVGADLSRFNAVVNQRLALGTRFVDGLLGKNSSELPSNYFDVAFSMSVIEHINDSTMLSVAEEIKRILCPGGFSAHSIDIYPRSKKAELWHVSTKRVGLEVPLPYYDKLGV